MVFFLMEMVWYRMLAPLLGGSTYSFGLILAVALLGIGLGGLGFSFRPSPQPGTLFGFALTTAIGAVFLALPLVLGDRIAILAGLLCSWDVFGFAGKVLAWGMITAVVVLPAALVSGFQFPLLLSLAGRGRTGIGGQVGLLYALNTLGAIVGSVAGGFGLMTLLSAPGCWRLATGLTLLLAGVFVVASVRREGTRVAAVLPVALGLLGVAMLGFPGPTPAWRDSAIGSGRSDLSSMAPNSLREWLNLQRRKTIWSADGKECSVSLSEVNSLAFNLNGKCDGNSLKDAPTQIMLGVIGALVHPAPKSAFVVGLGTGCTAGWLGVLPGMEDVVVAELEPMVLEMASRSTPINHGVLTNPKVHLRLGDAREILLTDNRAYDLIVSEPSNPFRSGIASLFTREFYQAAARRLKPGGLFSQWVQGYEIDVRTMKTIYATLQGVFPHIETWKTSDGDLVLICSQDPQTYSRAEIAGRIGQEPWKSALWQGWRTRDVEGVFSHFLANSGFATNLAAGVDPREVSTDDRMVVEFGLQRTMGQTSLGMMQALQVEASSHGFDRPRMRDGELDWNEVLNEGLVFLTLTDVEIRTLVDPDREFLKRVAAYTSYRREDFRGFVQNWSSQDRKPTKPTEFLILAEAFARFGGEQTLAMLAPARELFPGEAWLIEATWHHAVGSHARALECFGKGFAEFRSRPFPVEPILRRGMETAMNLGLQQPALASEVAVLLRDRFLLSAADELRVQALVGLVPKLEAPLAREICRMLEPHVPWQEEFLTARRDAYRSLGDPLAARAAAELAEFEAGIPGGGPQERVFLRKDAPAPDR